MEGRSEERKQGVRKETKKPRKGGNKIINKYILKTLRHDD